MNWSRVASSERFNFKGLCITKPADALSEGQYSVAENVRSFTDGTIQSRPQFTQAVPTINAPIQSLEPSIGTYKAGTNLYSFTAGEIATGLSPLPASLTPFRPNASPSSWEYVWDATRQIKYNASTGAVAKTGIPEPQTAAKFGITSSYFYSVIAQNISSYTAQGSTAANGGGSTRVNGDSIQSILQSADGGSYYSVVPANQAQEYGVGEDITIGGAGQTWPIFDVFPPVIGTFSIASIYYFSGTTGRCVIVPYPTTEASQLSGSAATLQTQQVAALRRGSVINLGGEVCYIESTTAGPNGDICFEVVTAQAHTAGTTFTGLGAFAICTMNGTMGRSAPTAGETISRTTTIVTVATGIGWMQPQNGVNANPFIIQGSPLSDQDYIHIMFNINMPQNVIEMKFELDVDDGSFSQNVYYATLRPSDIVQGAANNLTGPGVAQIAAQRAAIDEQTQDSVNSGQQFTSGSAWSDVFIPIKSLIRVGADRTKSLLTLKNYRFLWNVSASISVNIAMDFSVFGGFAPDSGSLKQDYKYRYRARSSATGARGNPSPEPTYGVRPRRAQVEVMLPTTAPDPQADLWDVFRRGGITEKYTLAGTATVASGLFVDNVTDLAIETNEELSFEHYEPFPSTGTPLTGTASVVGTAMLATFPLNAAGQALTLSQIPSLLPGNLITIGQVNYTLATRPVAVSASATTQTFLFRTVENADVYSGTFQIYEPLIAAQTSPAVWGPDVDGIFYAVGNQLQPGFVTQTNPNDPDSASDTGTTELAPPTEPLINGALLNATSIAFSSNRAWAGYPQNGKTAWKQIPVGAGLAATFGICSDGKVIYYVAKDSIRITGGGTSESITDDDLYPLFPHDGVEGVNVTYAGRTVYAPSYASYAGDFRLSLVNRFLYFDYRDSNGTYRTLVYDTVRKAWSVDSAGDAFTIHAGGTTDRKLYAGTASGLVLVEASAPLTEGETVYSYLSTKEEMFGELRATKLFGDAAIDAQVASTLTVQPYAMGLTAGVAATQAAGTRASYVFSFGGEIERRALGLQFSWNDQGAPTTLYLWQLSYIVQPELTVDRFTDWDNLGNTGAKWVQGFLLEADTADTTKGLIVRDSDTLSTHSFDSLAGASTIQHDGRSVIAYSFTTPFIAHQVRIEPDDIASWKMWNVQWVYEATPEAVFTWKTQPTAHGLKGWQHLRQLELAHASTATLIFTLTVDGVSYSYQIAPSGGQFVKTLVPLRAVKGKVFSYSVVSTAPFRLWHDDLEVYVKQWGSAGAYSNAPVVGGEMGATARV